MFKTQDRPALYSKGINNDDPAMNSLTRQDLSMCTPHFRIEKKSARRLFAACSADEDENFDQQNKENIQLIDNIQDYLGPDEPKQSFFADFVNHQNVLDSPSDFVSGEGCTQNSTCTGDLQSLKSFTVDFILEDTIADKRDLPGAKEPVTPTKKLLKFESTETNPSKNTASNKDNLYPPYADEFLTPTKKESSKLDSMDNGVNKERPRGRSSFLESRCQLNALTIEIPMCSPSSMRPLNSPRPMTNSKEDVDFKLPYGGAPSIASLQFDQPFTSNNMTKKKPKAPIFLRLESQKPSFLYDEQHNDVLQTPKPMSRRDHAVQEDDRFATPIPTKTAFAEFQVLGNDASEEWIGAHIRFSVLGQTNVRVIPRSRNLGAFTRRQRSKSPCSSTLTTPSMSSSSLRNSWRRKLSFNMDLAETGSITTPFPNFENTPFPNFEDEESSSCMQSFKCPRGKWCGSHLHFDSGDEDSKQTGTKKRSKSQLPPLRRKSSRNLLALQYVTAESETKEVVKAVETLCLSAPEIPGPLKLE